MRYRIRMPLKGFEQMWPETKRGVRYTYTPFKRFVQGESRKNPGTSC
jgi:hypothetical protein